MRLITLLMLCFALVGCEKEMPICKGKILDRDGLSYAANTNEPLTGIVEEYYDNGALYQTFILIFPSS